MAELCKRLRMGGEHDTERSSWLENPQPTGGPRRSVVSSPSGERVFKLGGPKNCTMNFVKKNVSKTVTKNRKIWYCVSDNMCVNISGENYTNTWPKSNASAFYSCRLIRRSDASSKRVYYITFKLIVMFDSFKHTK